MTTIRLLVTAIGFTVAIAGAAAPLSAQSVCSAPLSLKRELVYDDSQEPFDRVRAVAIDGTGNAVVSESDGNSLKVFRPNGTFSGRWGRTGEGPGEFRSIVSLLAMGDSVWAFDDRLRRGTFYRRDGTLGKIVNLPQTLPGSQMYGEAYPLGSNYLVLPGLMSSALATSEGFRRSLFLVTASEAPPREVAPPVLMRGVLAPLALPGGGLTHISGPTPRSDRAAVEPGGTANIVARGEVQNSGRRFVVLTRIAPRGDTLATRRVEVPRAPVDRAYLDREFSKAVEAHQRTYPNQAAARSAIREVWRPHDHFWPVASLFVDNDGRTWIRASPANNIWIIIRTTPQISCVAAPDDTRLVASAGNKVWGIRTDADGVQYLERYIMGIRQ